MTDNLNQNFNQRSTGTLPGYLAINFDVVEDKKVRASIQIQDFHMAPNGYLHAGTVVTLADSCCGYGCEMNLPEQAMSFTTVELKSNHLGTARSGQIECLATPVHLGRTTHVWDAVVSHKQTGKTIALFRCTQMVLYAST